MQRLSAGLCAIMMLAASVAAQSTRRDTLVPPREYYRLAMQVKAADSVAARSAAWQAWAAAEPAQVAPRFALAMLARFDNRYSDSFAWLDSASRVVKSPLWRNAVTRERINGRLVRGEFVDIPRLLDTLRADSAAVPREEWAESRLAILVANLRRGLAVSLASADSIAAIASPTDSVLNSKIACVRAGVDSREHLLENATKAMALADGAGVPFLSANCALLVGSVYAGAGEAGSALEWLTRAEQIARDAHDLPDLAAALQWHGYTLATIGYINSARGRLTESIRIAQQIDGRNVEAWALLAFANSAQQIGDAASTSLALRRAAILFDATGDTYGAENRRLEQAQALIALGDLAGAEQIAMHAISFADTIHKTSLALRAIYMVGNIAMKRQRIDDARRWLDSAERLVAIQGPRWRTQLDLYRGIVALRAGSNDEAIRLLSEVRLAFKSPQNLYLHNVTAALAQATLISGDSAKAATLLIAANDDLDSLRTSLSRGGLFRRVVSLPDAWGGSEGSIDEVLAAFVQSRRWLPTAFAVTERARSRALLKGAFGSESGDTAALTRAEQRVSATATNLTDVQRSMKPGTALLVYAGGAGRARTSLMLITKTSARGLTLARLDSLDRDIVRWLALLESGETGAGAGRRVAAAILGNVLRSIPPGINRLVIVPQGPLYRVPFQALPVGPGVLGDRVVVTISPSVSLALAYAAEHRSVPARVLALGAGDTEVAGFIPQALELNVERSERGNPLAPLRAAADEARAAAGWGRGSVALTGAEASESALKREARGTFTVLHAAAHALTSDQALGANWLILRADSTEDGYVSGGELAELSVGRAMVVLSGCRTTGDFGSRGDAIDGLVAPLLARGVRTVVASHWAVSDRWTKVLMERFYQNLARGVTTAEAMNSAQTSLRREGVPARFWAAFSVIGDGALTFEPSSAGTTGR